MGAFALNATARSSPATIITTTATTSTPSSSSSTIVTRNKLQQAAAARNSPHIAPKSTTAADPNTQYTFRETDFRLRKIKIQQQLLETSTTTTTTTSTSTPSPRQRQRQRQPAHKVPTKRGRKSLSKSLCVSNTEKPARTLKNSSFSGGRKKAASPQDVFAFTSDAEDDSVDLFRAKNVAVLPVLRLTKLTPRSSLMLKYARKRPHTEPDPDQECDEEVDRTLKKQQPAKMRGGAAKRMNLLRRSKRCDSNGASSSDTVLTSGFYDETSGGGSSELNHGCHGSSGNGGGQSSAVASSNSCASTDDDNSMEKTMFTRTPEIHSNTMMSCNAATTSSGDLILGDQLGAANLDIVYTSSEDRDYEDPLPPNDLFESRDFVNVNVNVNLNSNVNID